MTPDKDLSKVLWNDTPPYNGYQPGQYQDHVLEQYKLYVEMADRISNRRDLANAFFLTLNGLFFGAVGVLIDKGHYFDPAWTIFFPLTVLLFGCFFWWRLILSYKQLNGAKWNIVGELETRLPSSPYRNAEWKVALEEGKNRKVYWPLTHLESWIPLLFALGYLIAASAFVLEGSKKVHSQTAVKKEVPQLIQGNPLK